VAASVAPANVTCAATHAATAIATCVSSPRTRVPGGLSHAQTHAITANVAAVRANASSAHTDVSARMANAKP
jgi:hypothetical protein